MATYIKEDAADPKRDRLVIIASSLGTVFEWYDFFLYGILAALLGKLFFATGNPTTELLFSLFAFAIGFFFRPLGALLFGWFGDRVGRKYTFLVTIALMGGATACIGLLPTYEQAGITAPLLLLLLRTLQGLALGGEYGGAAIYVAEHAPRGRRGAYTSWIQAAAAGGFMLTLAVVLGTKALIPEAEFAAWGWRIPFLMSLLLLGISLWVRMKLAESPVFQAMKAAGTTSTNPFRDSLKAPGNIGRVLVALFGVSAGFTVIFYTSQFGTLYFLQNTARLAERDALLYLGIGVLASAPAYVYFGGLSDRIGRKKVLVIGYVLTLLLVFPLFHLMGRGANPALAEAVASAPVTVSLPACNYNVFTKQEAECGKALEYLSKRGISYAKRDADTLAITVGDVTLQGFDKDALAAVLAKAGWPEKADPARTVPWQVIIAVVGIGILSGMTYAPVAAILVELFPAKVRYTSMSIPYHIGTGYFGGFLPVISQYIVVKSGDVFAGLWYTVAIVTMGLVITVLFLPETKDRDITI
ncbi:MFS transporter [Sandarakinorhabdus sp.]|uniref:MFS transporter n=1 Tax=Sandarakinorhabdus sp. TaxID=1916663 RepID=UPI00286E2124|nr:MFS transporter [Sandarakinorhabdus sp.]